MEFLKIQLIQFNVMLKNKHRHIAYIISVIIAGGIFYSSFILNRRAEQLSELREYTNTFKNTGGIIDSNSILADSNAVFKFVTKEIIAGCPDSVMYKQFFLKERSKSGNLNHFLDFINYTIDRISCPFINIEQHDRLYVLTFSVSTSKNIRICVCFIKEGNRFRTCGISGFKDLILYLDTLLKIKA
jgi:hypothetical protein